jgi:phosphopantetheine adenylyltransferase
MKKIKAIFVGKFNPPHLGHALKIIELKGKYDLTIGITSDIPKNAVYSPRFIYNEIKRFKLPVKLLKGVLTEQKTNPFEGYLILSGNDKVIQWAKKGKYPCRFTKRIGKISGRDLRK